MQFSIAENISDENITKFILSDVRSTVYHLPNWLKAISEAIGHKGNYLLIYDDDNLAGVIPFIIENGVFNSLPYTTHCQPLIPENLSFEEAIENIKKLLPHIKGLRFKFRDFNNYNSDKTYSYYFNHVIFIGEDIEDYFNSLGRRSIRRFIKKSYNNGLKIRYGNNESDLKIFYNLECITRKSIGLPPAPYKFFLSIWKNLSVNDNIILPIVEKDHQPIASSLVLKFRDLLNFEYTGMDKKYIDLFPNHFLHWEVIKKAHTEFGSRVVDLGRTDKNNTGLIFFKEKWKAQRINLLEYCEHTKPRLKAGHLYDFLKWINKHLPVKFLKFEGKSLFKKFE